MTKKPNEPTEVKKTPKVVSLVDVKKSKADAQAAANGPELTVGELLTEGIEIFTDQVKAGAKGFISVVFDKDDNPIIVTVGDIDAFKIIGALDFCKTEITNTMIYGNMGPEIEFDLDE